MARGDPKVSPLTPPPNTSTHINPAQPTPELVEWQPAPPGGGQPVPTNLPDNVGK